MSLGWSRYDSKDGLQVVRDFGLIVAGFFVVCSLLLFVVCSLLLVLFLGTYFGKQLGGHRWSNSSSSSTVHEAVEESGCRMVQRRTVSPSILRNLAKPLGLQ